MKATLRLRLAVGVFASVMNGAAWADSLIGAGTWRTWTAASLGTLASPLYGGEYWNNPSGDGAGKNIGWCISGGGNCMLNAPGAVPTFAAGASPVADLSFAGSGNAVTASLLGINTNEVGPPPQGIENFGWYAMGAGGALGPLHYLWDSSAAAGATSAQFSPNGSYGFFLESVQGKGSAFEADYFWFMNTGDNFSAGPGAGPIAPTYQKFAIFSPNATSQFYLGIEDTLPSLGGDQDYNDMIVGVSVAPEPGAGVLLGIGLLAGGLFRQKRRS